MQKGKNETKNQKKKIDNAVYKFRFTKEQQRDLKTSFDVFDKDGTGSYKCNLGNIEIKDLKVILRALGFEPEEDEIKRLLSKINRTEENEGNKKGFSNNTIDWDEFLRIMNNKLV